jgi:hypothetical protein
MMVASIRSPPRVEVTARSSMFPDRYSDNSFLNYLNYSVLRESGDLVMIRDRETAREFVVVVNWPTELSRLTRGAAQ